jgi:phage protein D
MGAKNAGVKYKLTCAGVESTQPEPNGLMYLSVEDHVEMIGVCHATFTRDGADWSKFKVGEKVEVEVGDKTRKVFSGIITGYRHSWKAGSETITVIAMDPLVKMASSRFTKTFTDTKDSTAVEDAIKASGCKAGTVDATSGVPGYTFQRNESNFNFARRMAARNGYLLRANEGKIDFLKASFSDGAVEVDQKALMSLDYQVSPISVPADVTVIGWDYITKKKVEGSAASGDVDGIGGGKNFAADNGGIWTGTSYVSDVWVNSQTAAKDMAVAELNRLARRALRGRAVVQGNGEIFAGCKVTFKGLLEGFNPETFVVSARHLMEPNTGFTTEIQFCGNTAPA